MINESGLNLSILEFKKPVPKTESLNKTQMSGTENGNSIGQTILQITNRAIGAVMENNRKRSQSKEEIHWKKRELNSSLRDN